MSAGIDDCTHGTCSVRVFDIIASLYVAAFRYEYDGIHNGRPIDGGGTIDDLVTGACFADSFDLEQMVSDICFIYRIERQFKADGLYLYRNASLDEPSAIAATLDQSELALTDTAANGIEYAISTTYLDSANSLTKIAFNFLDADNDFKPNQLTAKSPQAVQTDPEKQVSLPFVMKVSEAETLVNRLIVDDRLSRITHNFRLPPKYAWLAKGDVIAIKHGIFTDTVRIKSTDFNADKSQTVSAVTVAAATTPVAAKQYQSQRTQAGGSVVDSLPLFFDIPSPSPKESTDPAAAGNFEMYYAAIPKTEGYWLGAYLARQLTKDSERYATLFHVSGKPTGNSYIAKWRALNALTNKRWVTDKDTLQLGAGNQSWPASKNYTRAQIDADPFLNLALYGDDGRWEMIQFERIVDGVMSGIVRGLRGTEGNCGKHVVGDQVYTLGPSLVMSRLPASYIGSTAKHRAVSEGNQFILSDQVQAPAFVGNSRRPFAPYHFTGTRGQDGAITFAWLRRDRGASGWGKPLANSESTLAFKVEIRTGDVSAALLRTVQATDSEFVYTAAMQQEDQSGGAATFKLSVYQIGDINLGFEGSDTIHV
jgi:hypothetical protein